MGGDATQCDRGQDGEQVGEGKIHLVLNMWKVVPVRHSRGTSSGEVAVLIHQKSLKLGGGVLTEGEGMK